MIQTQTQVQITDNSGLLKGRVINNKGYVGKIVKVAITKAKSKVNGLKKRASGSSQNRSGLNQSKNPIGMKGQCQDLLIIQTKKAIRRYDGSSLTFNRNRAVAVSLGKQRKLQLGFKRINTSLPFDLRRLNSQPFFRGSYNLTKLAKNSL